MQRNQNTSEHQDVQRVSDKQTTNESWHNNSAEKEKMYKLKMEIAELRKQREADQQEKRMLQDKLQKANNRIGYLTNVNDKMTEQCKIKDRDVKLAEQRFHESLAETRRKYEQKLIQCKNKAAFDIEQFRADYRNKVDLELKETKAGFEEALGQYMFQYDCLEKSKTFMKEQHHIAMEQKHVEHAKEINRLMSEHRMKENDYKERISRLEMRVSRYLDYGELRNQLSKLAVESISKDSTIESLKGDVATLTAERDRFYKKWRTESNLRSLLDQRQTSLWKTSNVVQMELSQEREKVHALREQVPDLKMDIVRLEEENQQYKDEARVANETIKELEDRLAELEAKGLRYAEALRRARSDADGAPEPGGDALPKVQHKEEASDWKSRCELLKSQLEQKERRIRAKEAKVNALQQARSDLYTRLERNTDSLSSSLRVKFDNMEQLRGAVRKHELEYRKLNQALKTEPRQLNASKAPPHAQKAKRADGRAAKPSHCSKQAAGAGKRLVLPPIQAARA